MKNQQLIDAIAERLQALGLSARKASLNAGLHPDAIRNIQRGATPRADRLRAIAQVLQVPPGRLLEITDEIDDGLDDPPEGVDNDQPPPRGYVGVPRLDVNAGMGGGGFADEDLMGAPILVPETLIRGELRGEPLDFLFMEVEGQSMEPILLSGDRVLIDRRKTNPTQAGLFAMYDGFGLVAKWVERVPKSDPPSLRIKSENERFSAYDVLVDEARIIGRIVWYARKL